MLATIRDSINKLKDPLTWLKVATTLEKLPTPTHSSWEKSIRMSTIAFTDAYEI